MADVAQSAEASDLKSAQCGFESRRPHYHSVDTLVGRCVLRKRASSWYIRIQRHGHRVERALGTNNLALAEKRAKKLAPIVMQYGYSADKSSKDGRPTAANYRRIFATAKRRAAKRGIDFSLNDEQLAALVARAAHHCEISGVPFSMLKRDCWFRAPYSPSLDRIDAALGYVPGNARLICVAANWALQDWGEDVFRRICHGYVLGLRGDEI